MNAIHVDNVTKIYRKGFRGVKVPAVTNLSFTVRRDAITGFVGPNGAGKTTTIKMIVGLAYPASGRVMLYGRDAALPSSRCGVAYLSEQPCFYAHLTVGEMLRFTAGLIGLAQPAISGEVERALGTVELGHCKKLKIKELSKGMQQRLSMAQALLGSPHTLILDEPMSGMDPPGRRLFRTLMDRLRHEGKTLFFSTHVLDDVESICDDVVVLQRGELTYSGRIKSLLDRGFLGTDIRTGEFDEKCRETLSNAGCRMQHHSETNEWTLFVPRDIELESVIRLLYEYSIVPVSIVGRSMTLEELLYKQRREDDR